MQNKAAGGKKIIKKPSINNHVELNEAESIELLAEIIANRIIEKILYDENDQSSVELPITRSSKKREAA